MMAVIDKTPISFNEFIDWDPEISETHYELRRGVIVDGEYEMQQFRGRERILSPTFPYRVHTSPLTRCS